jgi:hypothetical protein
MVRCAILPKAPLPVVWFDGRAGAMLGGGAARVGADGRGVIEAHLINQPHQG